MAKVVHLQRAAVPRLVRERGLTLVEVLVSFTIFGLVAMGISQLLILALTVNKNSRNRAAATAIATERVHDLMAQPIQPPGSHGYYKLPEEVVTDGATPTFTADYGTLQSYPDFKRVMTITYDTPVPGMHRVESRVFWRTAGGGEPSVSIVVYLHPHLEERR